MKKQINFKIFETKTHQVLIHKDFDEDNQDDITNFLIVMTMFVDGVKANYKFSYGSEEKRDKMFEQISQEQAEDMLKNTIKMLSEQRERS